MARTNGSTPRLGLYLTEERSGEYFHLHARAVCITDDGKIRNGVGYSDMVRGLYLRDLAVTCQGDARTRTPERGADAVYGWEVRYQSPHVVDADAAAKMHATFTTLTRKLDKAYQTHGAALSYGQYVGRVALALGADAIVWTTKDRPGGWSYDDAEHRIESLARGIAEIDARIAAWVTPADGAR